MSDFELSFELKQHTPIIHFQSEQHGATLRATELKPKFDKFLIKYAFDSDERKYKKFLVSQDKTSLNYKVNISVSSSKKGDIDLQKLESGKPKLKKDGKPDMQPFPCFFATMGKDWEENKKYFVFNSQIKVVFKSFNKDLLDKMKEFFPKFLMITNFGTRQSKGFGSFTANKCNGEDIIDNHTFMKDSKMKYWSFDVDISKYFDIKVCNSYQDYQEYYKLFDFIETLYKKLRSGINFRNTYFKSLLFKYVDEELQKTWDKKPIKEKFIYNINTSSNELYREFLGQSSIHEYKGYFKITQKTINQIKDDYIKNKLNKLVNKILTKKQIEDEIINLNINDDSIINLIKESKDNINSDFTVRHPTKRDNGYSLNEIERFKSPITFKPIKTDNNSYIVYVIPNLEDIDKIINKDYVLLKEIKVNQNNFINGSINLKTPSNFDLIAFLDFAFKEISVSELKL